MSLSDNMISDAELQALSKRVQKRFSAAAEEARNAVTLFDFGVARGLILALRMDREVDQSTLDRMYKRLVKLTPPAVMATIPPEYAASLGRGITVPAALDTRRKRP